MIFLVIGVIQGHQVDGGVYVKVTVIDRVAALHQTVSYQGQSSKLI
jgi:hypothetical protein